MILAGFCAVVLAGMVGWRSAIRPLGTAATNFAPPVILGTGIKLASATPNGHRPRA